MKRLLLSHLSIYYTWKNIKNSYNNNKCKISNNIQYCKISNTPTWINQFELPDGLYSVLHIQDYIEHILKKALRKYR